MKLREYQERCIQDCIDWIKKSVEPAVVDATVSFGKSITIAVLADKIRAISGKMVLVLCPNGNLVKQNSEEMAALNIPHSLFSASHGQKSLRHPIVIGTPLTIKNYLSRFGSQFAAILIDEGDGLTDSVIKIVNNIKGANPNTRVIGFTGTPFRTTTGYIYQLDLYGNPVPETQTINPFYARLIHKTGTKYLMDQGYLTPMVVGDAGLEKYDTRHLIAGKKWLQEDIDRAYVGQDRKTAAIVADIVAKSAWAEGVMIFGATRQHCEEIMASLPKGLARMVADGMPDNAKNLKDFKAKRYKYLVNRDMATVGSNFPHVGVIAVCRKTSSARLLTQILGRGVRLHKDNWDVDPGTPELRKEAIAKGPKPFCLYLDYTIDNIETHFPDGDIWEPKIEVSLGGKSNGEITCKCPDCGTQNTFGARKNNDRHGHDEYGYFTDLAGDVIKTDYGPMPAHMGRRCMGMLLRSNGVYERCEYRWTSKDCPSCGEANDIAARYCYKCKGEIINPNDALRVEFARLKKDPTQRQCDIVTAWKVTERMSQRGKAMFKIHWSTEHRSFETWTQKEPDSTFTMNQHRKLMDGTSNLTVMPRTISYKKGKSGFYEILGFDEKEDIII